MDHFAGWRKTWRSPSPDPKAVATPSEQRRLFEVNSAAARFYRRELFRDKAGWGREFLRNGGAAELLESDSRWIAGYAPAARSRLVDHLRSQGFDWRTIKNAGLGVVGPDDRLIDRFRHQLMLPARNHRLGIVGFTGVREGEFGPYYSKSPDTQIHRRSGSIIGLAEQLDLLSEGASPVLVDHPLDAFAIERISRLTGGRWAGIPLCDAVLSPEQARILGVHATTDKVIVLITKPSKANEKATESLNELTTTFRRVQAAELPRGYAPASLWKAADGHQRLHDNLLVTRPLSDYLPSRRSRRPRTQSLHESPPDLDDHPVVDLP